jgi:hypothetical protein
VRFGRGVQRRRMQRGLLHRRRLLHGRAAEPAEPLPGVHPGGLHDRLQPRA